MRKIMTLLVILLMSASILPAAPKISGVQLKDSVIYDGYDYKFKARV